jgi:hypothetical protein
MMSRIRSMFTGTALRRGVLLALLALCPVALTGCWLFAAEGRMAGTKVEAEYKGLANSSVAIVIYADQATTDEFTENRKEIATFVATQIREHIPTAQVLNPQEVINWQDDTINWYGLPEKDIAKHFKVDRVLYIELLTYSARMGGGYGDLQGHIRANCRIFEAGTPGSAAAWTGLIDEKWPKDAPLDATATDERAVRARTLQVFAESLINYLYDHKEYDNPMRDDTVQPAPGSDVGPSPSSGTGKDIGKDIDK